MTYLEQEWYIFHLKPLESFEELSKLMDEGYQLINIRIRKAFHNISHDIKTLFLN